jgi:hypothetical protein
VNDNGCCIEIRIKTPHQPDANFVKEALEQRGLMDAYHSRPAYQQNDYLGWINARSWRQLNRTPEADDELEGGTLHEHVICPETEGADNCCILVGLRGLFAQPRIWSGARVGH